MVNENKLNKKYASKPTEIQAKIPPLLYRERKRLRNRLFLLRSTVL